MSTYIQAKAETILSEDQVKRDSYKFMLKLLNLSAEINNMVEKSFKNDIRFKNYVNVFFRNFMKKSSFTSYYMVEFCDIELKRKDNSDKENNELFKAIINLFCLLEDQDVFIKEYSNKLALRLLYKSYSSIEAENLMIKNLSLACGLNNVNKLTSMIKEIMLTKDLINEYRQIDDYNLIKAMGVEFDALVLANGHWNIQRRAPCILPLEIKNITINFEKFYKQKFQKRKLTWLLNYGSAEIKPIFIIEKHYIFVMNCYQSIILLLFNNHEELTYLQVKQLTGISETGIQHALFWLCNPKNKNNILLKENMKTPVFKDEEKIYVVKNFQNASIKVTFTPPEVYKKKEMDDEEIKSAEKD